MTTPGNPLLDYGSGLRIALMMALQIIDANSDREIRLTQDVWQVLSDANWVTCSDVSVVRDGESVTERRFLLTKLGKRELEAQERWVRKQGAAQALGLDGGA